MSINNELLDRLLANYNHGESGELLGENGLLKQFTKVVLEQALHAKIVHLGDQKKNNTVVGKKRSGHDGASAKTIVGNFGARRQADAGPDHPLCSEPDGIPKGVIRPSGLNDRIIALYVRGMASGEIQKHLKDVNEIDVPVAMIAALTDAVAGEVETWRNRPLEAVYPLVYIDSIRAKVRDAGRVVNRVVYQFVGVTMDGVKDVLGMWVAENEGVKFWQKILNELKKRGVQDVFIVCVDGLKGFPEACRAVFPAAHVQLYIAHLVRSCLKFVSWKERKEVVNGLKAVYQAETVEQAEAGLRAFEERWEGLYPSIGKSWRENWDRVVSLFAYSPDLRKVIYTTNTMESLNTALCKIARDRRAFANDALMLQLLYLVLTNVTKKWTMPVRDWKAGLNQFSILFGDRMPTY